MNDLDLSKFKVENNIWSKRWGKRSTLFYCSEMTINQFCNKGNETTLWMKIAIAYLSLMAFQNTFTLKCSGFIYIYITF